MCVRKDSRNEEEEDEEEMTTDEAAATKGMEKLKIGGGGGAPKGTAKRDALRANEVKIQQEWEEQAAFEVNPEEGKESFMVTFPYPYSNGHLHIGHAFSLTKAIFRAQYERHQGKNVLFPFAFHCTGMPIQAVRVITKKKIPVKTSQTTPKTRVYILQRCIFDFFCLIYISLL